MQRLYLVTLSVFYTFTLTFANNGVGVRFPAPTINFTSYPPSNPTPTPAVNRLEPGQVFADPGSNPFRRSGTFIYGPLNTTTFGSANLTGLPIIDRDDPCQLGVPVHGLLDRWGKHHMAVVYPNATTQRVGFSVDVFQQGEQQGPASSEITRGIEIQFDSGTNVSDWRKRWIFPPDGRVEIFNTWVFPFSTVGRTTSDIFSCSATLIGPRHVLTAGHCVHWKGKWAGNLKFNLIRRPGVGGAPFTTTTFVPVRVAAPVGWVQDGNWDFDYAIIELSTSPNAGWSSFGWSSGLGSSWRVNANGYPGDKDPRTMWNTFDAISDARDNSFDHFLDIVPGSSGSGIYLYLPEQNSRVIYGVVSNESKKFVISFPDIWNSGTVMINTATRINAVRFRLICAWMNDPSVC